MEKELTGIEKEILKELLPPDYKDYAPDKMSRVNFVRFLCGAPISLHKKIEYLEKLNAEGIDIEFENYRYSKLLLYAKDAMNELEHCNDNESLLLEFMGIEHGDQVHCGSVLCGSMNDVNERILLEYDSIIPSEITKLQKENMTWEELTKYKITEGKAAPLYKYGLLGGEVFWFYKENSKGKEFFYSFLFSQSSDFGVNCPYEPGTIVKIDTRPWAPVAYGVVLQNNHSGDCCDPWSLYFNPDLPNLCKTGALNHNALLRFDKYINAPSCIYQIEKVGWIENLSGGRSILQGMTGAMEFTNSVLERNLARISRLIDGSNEIADCIDKTVWELENKIRKGWVPVDFVIEEVSKKRGDLLEKEAARYHCNMCGKKFSLQDYYERANIDFEMGAGSAYDESRIRAKLCCSCEDKIIKYLSENSVDQIVFDDKNERDAGWKKK